LKEEDERKKREEEGIVGDLTRSHRHVRMWEVRYERWGGMHTVSWQAGR